MGSFPFCEIVCCSTQLCPYGFTVTHQGQRGCLSVLLIFFFRFPFFRYSFNKWKHIVCREQNVELAFFFKDVCMSRNVVLQMSTFIPSLMNLFNDVSGFLKQFILKCCFLGKTFWKKEFGVKNFQRWWKQHNGAMEVHTDLIGIRYKSQLITLQRKVFLDNWKCCINRLLHAKHWSICLIKNGGRTSVEAGLCWPEWQIYMPLYWKMYKV